MTTKYPYVTNDKNLVRYDHTYTQCFTMEYEVNNHKVRFTASGSKPSEGERALTGLLFLDADKAREFLTQALAQIPEKPKTEVTVVSDRSGDDWVPLPSGNYTLVRGFESTLQAIESGREGLSLIEVVSSYGVRTTRKEWV